MTAVADGRHAVSIKRLSEQGKDVPVYCIDETGKLDVRRMRNPRITGYNQDIYGVKLDNGFQIKCTGNHKFILKDGSMKQALELNGDDSLYISTKPIYTKNEDNGLLQNQLQSEMHHDYKVVSVQYIGKGDVYNGTVDK